MKAKNIVLIVGTYIYLFLPAFALAEKVNGQTETASLPVLSLIVAALAVFFGPLISWFVAKRQTEVALKNADKQSFTSLRIANKQIIAPMRQAWINNLRDLLAELLGKCEHYWAAGFEDREDQEYQRITELKNKLALFINPNEKDHLALLEQAQTMIGGIGCGKSGDEKFWTAHKSTMELSQKILKTEWNRVKEEI